MNASERQKWYEKAKKEDIPLLPQSSFPGEGHELDNSMLDMLGIPGCRCVMSSMGLEIAGYTLLQTGYRPKPDCGSVLIDDMKSGRSFWFHVPYHLIEVLLGIRKSNISEEETARIISSIREWR